MSPACERGFGGRQTPQLQARGRCGSLLEQIADNGSLDLRIRAAAHPGCPQRLKDRLCGVDRPVPAWPTDALSAVVAMAASCDNPRSCPGLEALGVSGLCGAS